MLTQWLTVVDWQNGKVRLRYETRSACGQCAAQDGCGSRLLNRFVAGDRHLLTLDCPTPLVVGQRVELAMAQSHLLVSALLVYLLPVLGLLAVAGLFQTLFASDLAALAGAACGALLGVVLARYGWRVLNQRYGWQPTIVTIAPP